MALNHSTVKVILVKEAPAFVNPHIQAGIRSKAEAEHWGEKNGHVVVYFMEKRQRVYVPRQIRMAGMTMLPRKTESDQAS